MRTYKENDSVIYTDSEGNRIDTFVIFNTDKHTGLTHINHQNLLVAGQALELHSRSASGHAIPMGDPASFELFRQLKQKFLKADRQQNETERSMYPYNLPGVKLLSKAS
jgi:hypothetical protein